MEVKVYKVKQYNSVTKTVVCVNGKPVCICGNGKTLAKVEAYLQGYQVDIKDGKIKKALDEVMKGAK